MDSYRTAYVLVEIVADGDTEYLTNYPDTLTVDTYTYSPQPQMVLDIPEKTGSAGGSEGSIKNLESPRSMVLAKIAGGYPYNQVTLTIKEIWVDDSLTVTNTWTHFNGKLYQKESLIQSGLLNLTIKDWKYYTDMPGGVPCTEFCFVSRFGDKICGASVPTYPVTILAISETDVVVDSVPTVQDFLFNKGYFKYDSTTIKVKFWESGTTFQTSEPIPASWEGLVVELVAGCDKTLTTCRNIHDNEENFSGWGYSMVDYNPLYEEPSSL